MFATASVPTLRKASVPTVDGALPSKVTEVSAVASWNAEMPIEVSTLSTSKVNGVSAVAPANAASPIEVTLFGMVIEGSGVVRVNAC